MFWVPVPLNRAMIWLAPELAGGLLLTVAVGWGVAVAVGAGVVTVTVGAGVVTTFVRTSTTVWVTVLVAVG